MAGRAARAEQFAEAAEIVAAVQEGEQDLAAVLVTLYVHAGIAAADVLCCRRLGHHAQGHDHAEAVALMKTAHARAAADLDVLLRLKTPAGYSHQPVSEADRKRARRAALSLLEAMRAG